ncbi:MAG: glycosyltransferase family 87 protein [Thermoguttaceae bacterium]|jgi:hypothetical protein
MDFHFLPIETAWRRYLRLRFCWRWLVIPFFLVCIWGWCDVRLRGYPHPEDPLQHKTDLTVYTEAGAAFFDGRPPYEVSNPRGWTYLYPPMFAMLMAPLHLLPSQDQVMIWFIVSLLLCWGCIYECAKTLRCLCDQDDHVARHYTAWYPWLGLAAVFAAALPTLNCLQRGQVGILKFYLLALGLRLVISGRTHSARLLGGIVLALPIVLKIVPLLPVSFLIFVQFVIWIKSRRSRGPSSTIAARQAAGSSLRFTSLGLILGLLMFFLLIPSMLIGWKANLHHLKTWSGFVLTKADDGGDDPRSGNSHSTRNQSLQNAAYRLGNFVWHQAAGGPDDQLADSFELPKTIFERPEMIMDSPTAESVLLGLRLAVLAALCIVGIRLGLQRDALSLATAFSLGCIAMLVVSPIARAHYFLLFAPAILYLPLWLDRQNHARAAKIMAVVPIILVDLHYIFLSYAGRVGLLGLGTTAWLLTAFVLVMRGGRQAAAPAMPESVPQNSFQPAIRQAA